MTWTLSSVTIKDGNSASKTILQGTDGTNFAPAAALLDNTGAIMNPATAGNQATGNTSLATIATNTTGVATAANQTTGNTSLATIATNTGNILAKGQATMAN